MRSHSLSFPLVKILTGGLGSQLMKAGGLVLTANLLSGVISFAAVIITIRYLSPEAFGILTFALTTMQLVGMLSNAGLNETLMTMISRAEASQRPTEVTQALSAIFRLRLVVSIAVATGGLLLARPIAEVFFRQAELTFPLALGMVGACGISLLQFNQTALQAFRAYGRHAVVVLVRYTVILVPLILLATINRLGLTSTLVVNIGAPFLVFTLSLSYVSVGISRGAGNPLALLPHIWHLSKWVVVINLCSMFFSRLEIYFLTAFASPTELGIYSAAVKLCGGMLILEVAVRTVLFPEISRRASMPGDLASFTRRSVVALGLVTGIVYGLGLLASPFIPVLVGERYAASVPIFLIVLAARAAVIPLVPLSLLFYPTNSTRAGAVFAATQLVVLVVFGLILVPTYGAAGAAWTSVLVSLAGWLYLGLFARSYLTGLRLPVRVSAEQVS